ncbi:MAG: hypothetical protein [Bacteriophage sp.]|nr:MAG: hypothetical protein [Bacteriophage sp.]
MDKIEMMRMIKNKMNVMKNDDDENDDDEKEYD